MSSRIASLVVILIVACVGVGVLIFVLQAPRDPDAGPPPPGFEIPDYTKNPPPAGPGAGDPAKGPVDWKPDSETTKKGKGKKGESTQGTGKSKDTP